MTKIRKAVAGQCFRGAKMTVSALIEPWMTTRQGSETWMESSG